MLERAAAAGRDDRNADHLHDRLGERQVEAGLGAVLVHRGQQDLARAALVNLFRPRDRVLAGRGAAACNVNLKAGRHFGVRTRVDRDHNALAAVFLRGSVHQIGILDRRGIDGNFICTGA